MLRTFIAIMLLAQTAFAACDQTQKEQASNAMKKCYEGTPTSQEMLDCSQKAQQQMNACTGDNQGNPSTEKSVSWATNTGSEKSAEGITSLWGNMKGMSSAEWRALCKSRTPMDPSCDKAADELAAAGQ